ncbi:hypothetical protein CRN32_24300 [Vibrio vulnificus]|uniref:DUF488 domain-containing protein n=1 Tax=Vibrio vulnificus TaxID=672 RepID=UPI000CD16787|nr:DUF488 domain-containing protein [Vibrio vulnificus]EJC6737679.1 DUF488 domain-containing protein [Vibrio vulnificus]POC45942.1 hypothetical protein CRN32_24300 [Vibrio vulnificus]
MKLYTIGAYGKSEDEFFDLIIKNGVTCFFDIRQRRGVRGSKYKFVNSKYLQSKLMKFGVRYNHIKDLAPTIEIRQVQKNKDLVSNTNKRERQLLSEEFCCLYDKEILENYQFSQEMSAIKNGESVVFFCVEEEHLACHRSLVTEKLKKIDSSLEVVHL